MAEVSNRCGAKVYRIASLIQAASPNTTASRLAVRNALGLVPMRNRYLLHWRHWHLLGQGVFRDPKTLTYRAIYDLQYYEGFVAGSGPDGYRTNVRSSIKRIRRKFCEIDSTFSEIQNSASRGYRWRGLTIAAERGMLAAPLPPNTPQEPLNLQPHRP
jgi:hypothetical protein